MKKTLLGLVTALLALLPCIARANTIDVVMFYGDGCPHCAQMESHLETLKAAYPELQVHAYEIYFQRQNIDLMNKFSEEYDTEISGVPTLFIGDHVVVGYRPDELDANLKECIESGCTSPLDRVSENKPTETTTETKAETVTETVTETINDISTSEASSPLPSRITIPAVISGAAVDAINPCAFAVLIILMTTILASGNRRKALLSGLAFSLSVFISYLMMGLGLYSAIQAASLSRTFYLTVGILAIIIGLFNLKDFLWYGKWFVMEVPLSWRPRLKALIHGVTSVPGAFVVGFAVSVFLLPCTSGPYIVILGMLSHTATKSAAIPLLMLYNAIFVMPMIIITLAIAGGLTTTEKAESWRQGKLRILHLIAGLIILTLGIVMLFGYFRPGA